MIVGNTSTLAMILDVARAKGTAPATLLRLHPTVVTTIRAEDGPTALDTCGVPVEVDHNIASFPGFDVERAPR